MRTYEGTHPWITFDADLQTAPLSMWMMLGECQSMCDQLAHAPLKPSEAEHLHRMFLARGVQGTVAIEGNTLTIDQVKEHIDGKLELPPSQKYLQQEINTIVNACNQIGENITESNIEVLSYEIFQGFNKNVLDGLELEDGVVPGEISKRPVRIGNYIGAPREDCEYLLRRLSGWLNQDIGLSDKITGISTAIIKSIIAHLYIAWIHAFGDGNGRTARLVEFYILFTSGAPQPATHLLSNFYNQTRSEYYRQLDRASKSRGDIIPFLLYAIEGLRDGLNDAVEMVWYFQVKVAWNDFVHEQFKGDTRTVARRRHLVIDMTHHDKPVSVSQIPDLSPRLAREYANKTTKTITRDLNKLIEMNLVRTTEKGYEANWRRMSAFFPVLIKQKTPNQS